MSSTSVAPTYAASSSSSAKGEQSDIVVHDLHPEPDDMRGDVLAGLRAQPKTLPCKYFYDQRGSELFDEICELDEYYPTRTEIGILERCAQQIAEHIGERALVIELGSGSSTKTHVLLEALKDAAGYVPVDISREHLRAAARRIDAAFPGLAVQPICADFTTPFRTPSPMRKPDSRYVFFPGSTLGNFDPAGRRKLLEQIVALCAPEGGGLLVGLDLIKDRRRLEAAYNDGAGVTAAFNLNLLKRLNRELETTFDVNGFRHHAPFNPKQERIEMHLISDADQIVAVGSERIEVRAGEVICTEHSYKFDIDRFSELASEVGLQQKHVWTDPNDLFAVVLLEVS